LSTPCPAPAWGKEKRRRESVWRHLRAEAPSGLKEKGRVERKDRIDFSGFRTSRKKEKEKRGKRAGSPTSTLLHDGGPCYDEKREGSDIVSDTPFFSRSGREEKRKKKKRGGGGTRMYAWCPDRLARREGRGMGCGEHACLGNEKGPQILLSLPNLGGGEGEERKEKGKYYAIPSRREEKKKESRGSRRFSRREGGGRVYAPSAKDLERGGENEKGRGTCVMVYAHETQI